MLVAESAQAGGEDSGTAEIAHHFAVVAALDHGQALNVEAQQFAGGL